MLYICDLKYNTISALRTKHGHEMETAVVNRKQTAFRLKEDLLARLKVEAKKANRSLNNYVESVLMDVVYKTPNEETLSAMKEAKEGKKLEKLNLDTFEDYVASL